MDEDYPFYQFNCSSGKQLIQDIKEFNSPVLICYTDESNGSVIVNFRPALPVLEEMLSIHNSVDNDHIDSRGAEIASMYGY